VETMKASFLYVFLKRREYKWSLCSAKRDRLSFRPPEAPLPQAQLFFLNSVLIPLLQQGAYYCGLLTTFFEKLGGLALLGTAHNSAALVVLRASKLFMRELANRPIILILPRAAPYHLEEGPFSCVPRASHIVFRPLIPPS